MSRAPGTMPAEPGATPAAPPHELWSASRLIAHQLVHAGFAFASTYPGSPTTLIAEELEALDDQGLIRFRYATNEKVAFEMAAAFAFSGGRAAVLMKHVGLNVALDAAMGVAHTGQLGALLLIVGDDPSCDSSSSESDSRLVARQLGIPCLEPSGVGDLAQTLDLASDLSTRTEALVMLRLTTSLCHSSAPVAFQVAQAPAAGLPSLNPPRGTRRFNLTPETGRASTPRALARLEAARSAAGAPTFWREEPGNGGSTGFLLQSALVERFRRACFRLGCSPPAWHTRMAWPVAQPPLKAFLAKFERVVVLEEMEPLLEEQATLIAHREGLRTRIEGSNLRPRSGRVETAALEGIIAWELGLAPPAPAAPTETLKLPARPPTFCPGCPHTASFFTIKRVVESLPARPFIATDIGCYTLGTKAGLDIGDTNLCMGSSIGIATGAALAGHRSIAIIGDSTFLHAGLPSLRNAVDQRVDLLVCVLDNDVAAMTGGQPTGHDPDHLVRAALGLGARAEAVDPFDVPGMENTMRRLLASAGVSVLVSKSPCALTQQPQPRRPSVDLDRCTGCADCVTKIHCPAISLSAQKKFQVDVQACVGCGFCSAICPEHALTPTPFPDVK